MPEKDKKPSYLERLEESLSVWTDERLVSREDIRVWYLFLEYIVNLAEGDGWTYDGHSFSTGLPMSLLVVRGTIDGVPCVVFSSGRTATACIRAFFRKMEEGWLEWQKDRFRG